MGFTFAGFSEVQSPTDTNGTSFPSASITVYLDNGVTQASLFTDANKGTPVTQPITADAIGNFNFFADPGYYRVQVTPVGSAALPKYRVFVASDPAEDTGPGGTPLLVADSVQTITVTSGTTAPTINLALGGEIELTLQASMTGCSFTNIKRGQLVTIHIVQDSTGGRTVNLGSQIVFATGTPTFPSAANSTDTLSFSCNDVSTKLYEIGRGGLPGATWQGLWSSSVTYTSNQRVFYVDEQYAVYVVTGTTTQGTAPSTAGVVATGWSKEAKLAPGWFNVEWFGALRSVNLSFDSTSAFQAACDAAEAHMRWSGNGSITPRFFADGSGTTGVVYVPSGHWVGRFAIYPGMEVRGDGVSTVIWAPTNNSNNSPIVGWNANAAVIPAGSNAGTPTTTTQIFGGGVRDMLIMGSRYVQLAAGHFNAAGFTQEDGINLTYPFTSGNTANNFIDHVQVVGAGRIGIVTGGGNNANRIRDCDVFYSWSDGMYLGAFEDIVEGCTVGINGSLAGDAAVRVESNGGRMTNCYLYATGMNAGTGTVSFANGFGLVGHVGTPSAFMLSNVEIQDCTGYGLVCAASRTGGAPSGCNTPFNVGASTTGHYNYSATLGPSQTQAGRFIGKVYLDGNGSNAYVEGSGGSVGTDASLTGQSGNDLEIFIDGADSGFHSSTGLVLSGYIGPHNRFRIFGPNFDTGNGGSQYPDNTSYRTVSLTNTVLIGSTGAPTFSATWGATPTLSQQEIITQGRDATKFWASSRGTLTPKAFNAMSYNITLDAASLSIAAIDHRGNVMPTDVMIFILTQDSTGSRAVVWDSSYLNAPTPNTTPNSTTVAPFLNVSQTTTPSWVYVGR